MEYIKVSDVLDEYWEIYNNILKIYNIKVENRKYRQGYYNLTHTLKSAIILNMLMRMIYEFTE